MRLIVLNAAAQEWILKALIIASLAFLVGQLAGGIHAQEVSSASMGIEW